MLDIVICVFLAIQFSVDAAMIAFAVYLYRNGQTALKNPQVVAEIFNSVKLRTRDEIISEWEKERDKHPEGSPRREAFDKRLKALRANND